MAHGLACPVCSATPAAADPTRLLPPHRWGAYEEPLELAAPTVPAWLGLAPKGNKDYYCRFVQLLEGVKWKDDS